MSSMTAATKLKSIATRLVPGRLAGDIKKTSEAQAPDQHMENISEEFLPPLRPVTFPKIIPYHQNALSDQGWSTITYENETDKLHEAAQALFQASQAFFNLPISYKETFKTEIGSEEGWSRIEGEKELITLRCLENTPKELQDAAAAYWAEAGGLLNEILGRIAQSLGLPAEALTAYSFPCAKLPIEKTSTMLRLFRYEGFEGKQSKTVAERISHFSPIHLAINPDTNTI
jgi:isopenicillin N synthase-like dioxygenase